MGKGNAKGNKRAPKYGRRAAKRQAFFYQQLLLLRSMLTVVEVDPSMDAYGSRDAQPAELLVIEVEPSTDCQTEAGRVWSMAVWKHGAKDAAIFNICGLKYQVLELLRAGLKTLRGLSAEVRSAKMCKSFLVSACDAVRTARKELHYCGEDDAEAADLILCAVLSRSSGVRLHGAAPLYLHCGAEFVAVMQQPQLLVSRQSVLVSLGQGEESFITNSDMSAFPFVILGTPWKLPAHGCGWVWPKFASQRFAVVGGSGQLQTVKVRHDISG